MVGAEKCLETFLDGVSDLYLYTPKETVLPIPFNVGQLTEMNKCQLPKTPALHMRILWRAALRQNRQVQRQRWDSYIPMI